TSPTRSSSTCTATRATSGARRSWTSSVSRGTGGSRTSPPTTSSTCWRGPTTSRTTSRSWRPAPPTTRTSCSTTSGNCPTCSGAATPTTRSPSRTWSATRPAGWRNCSACWTCAAVTWRRCRSCSPPPRWANGRSTPTTPGSAVTRRFAKPPWRTFSAPARRQGRPTPSPGRTGSRTPPRPTVPRSSHVMSILLVSEIFPPRTGGSGRWFWEIYRRLPRGRVVVAAGEHPRQEEFDRVHDLRVARLPLTLRQWGLLSREGLRGYAAAVGRLRSLVREEGVGVVHCARCLPEGVMSLALRWLTGVPYLCYVHGEDVTGATTSRELHFLARRVLRQASLVIANSHNTQRILRGDWRLPAGRVRVLHPGVDTERFVPAPRDHGGRARLGWGGRPVVPAGGRRAKGEGRGTVVPGLPARRPRGP